MSFLSPGTAFAGCCFFCLGFLSLLFLIFGLFVSDVKIIICMCFPRSFIHFLFNYFIRFVTLSVFFFIRFLLLCLDIIRVFTASVCLVLSFSRSVLNWYCPCACPGSFIIVVVHCDAVYV